MRSGLTARSHRTSVPARHTPGGLAVDRVTGAGAGRTQRGHRERPPRPGGAARPARDDHPRRPEARMDTEALGPAVRRFRLAADLTLERLSELSGVSDRALSDIERGAALDDSSGIRKIPSARERAIQFARALNADRES